MRFCIFQVGALLGLGVSLAAVLPATQTGGQPAKPGLGVNLASILPATQTGGQSAKPDIWGVKLAAGIVDTVSHGLKGFNDNASEVTANVAKGLGGIGGRSRL